MTNNVIWCKNASMGANISMGIKGSTSTRPHIDLYPTIFIILKHDYDDMFGLCVMTKI